MGVAYRRRQRRKSFGGNHVETHRTGLARSRSQCQGSTENCSISWATDENLSASGPRFDGPDPEAWRKNTSHQILFRKNLIAEGLSRSTHSEEEHSKGSLIHDNVTQIALIGNLYVSNMQRNPLFKGGTRALFANNMVHNPGEWAVQYILVKKEWEGKPIVPGELVLVGNVVQYGPDTPPEMPIGNFIGQARAYIHDNRVLNPKTANLGIPWVGTYEELKEAPFWLKDYNARPSSNTLAWVLDNAGARPWSRDATDRRLIEEVRNRSGSIKDSEKEAEGYPQSASVEIP